MGKLQRQLSKLVKPGTCPECDRNSKREEVCEVIYTCAGPNNEDREPIGWLQWLQESVENGRLVLRPYPPDLRPICSTCGERKGVLFLEAIYAGDPEAAC